MQGSFIDDFWLGFGWGAILTFIGLMIVTWFFGLYRRFVTKIQEADKPMAITHKTEKTAQQIVDEADRAKRNLLFLLLICFLGALILLEIVRPGTIADVLMLFGL